jgi:hypothetical protein
MEKASPPVTTPRGRNLTIILKILKMGLMAFLIGGQFVGMGILINLAMKSTSPRITNSTVSYITEKAVTQNDYDRVKWPAREEVPATRRIWQNQHPKDCSQAKFIVWRFPDKESTRNFGSIYIDVLNWMFLAIDKGRVLILDDRDWSLGDCALKSSECYFKAITHCKIENVMGLPSEQRFLITELSNEAYIKLETDNQKQKRVWIAPDSWSMEMDVTKKRAILWPSITPRPLCHSQTAILQYLLQPQDWVKRAIEAKLAGVFPIDFDPSRTIGLPIRASDKCRGHSIGDSAGGEHDCKEVGIEEAMRLVDEIHAFDPTVDTLILTSEDPATIQRGTQLASQHAGAWPLSAGGKGLRVLTNRGDAMQGSGSATFLVEKAKADNSTSVADQVVSALSSLHLQLRARYLIATYSTSFHLTMQALHRSDHLTFTSDRLAFPLGPKDEQDPEGGKRGPEGGRRGKFF